MGKGYSLACKKCGYRISVNFTRLLNGKPEKFLIFIAADEQKNGI